jgi:hypothetical protein
VEHLIVEGHGGLIPFGTSRCRMVSSEWRCAHRKMHDGPAHRLVTTAVGDESENTPP